MNEISDFLLDLPFKGNRDYLHSTTAYRALMARLGAGSISNPRLIFKGIAKTQLKAVSSDPEKKAKATFSCQIDSKPVRLSLVETGAEISGTEPCSEDAIGRACCLNVETKEISLESKFAPGIELIDIVVAMNKTLHQAVFRDHLGKWLFTEVRSDEPLVDRSWTTLRIFIKNQLGTHLTRSVIEIDGTDAGYIGFSLLEPLSPQS